MIHDAFQPLSFWNGFMQPPNWEGVILDTHLYQMFSDAVSLFLAVRSSAMLTFSRRTTCLSNNISRQHVVRVLGCPQRPFGPLSVNGHLQPRTALNISMGVELAPVTKGHSLVRPVWEVVLALREKLRRSAQATRLSFASSGKLRQSLMRGAKVGFNGRGRRKVQTNGPMKQVWLMDGFPKAQPIANSLISVARLFLT